MRLGQVLSHAGAALVLVSNQVAGPRLSSLRVAHAGSERVLGRGGPATLAQVTGAFALESAHHVLQLILHATKRHPPVWVSLSNRLHAIRKSTGFVPLTPRLHVASLANAVPAADIAILLVTAPGERRHHPQTQVAAVRDIVILCLDDEIGFLQHSQVCSLHLHLGSHNPRCAVAPFSRKQLELDCIALGRLIKVEHTSCTPVELGLGHKAIYLDPLPISETRVAGSQLVGSGLLDVGLSCDGFVMPRLRSLLHIDHKKAIACVAEQQRDAAEDEGQGVWEHCGKARVVETVRTLAKTALTRGVTIDSTALEH